MQTKEQIQLLKDGESYIIPESDYGKAEIWLKNNYYFLFSIPIAGGEPCFEKVFFKKDIDNLIKEYESWT